MRISTGKRWWLATTYLVLRAANGQDVRGGVGSSITDGIPQGQRPHNHQEDGVVTFESADFIGNWNPTRAIFFPRSSAVQNINWAATGRVAVSHFELWQYHHKGPMMGHRPWNITSASFSITTPDRFAGDPTKSSQPSTLDLQQAGTAPTGAMPTDGATVPLPRRNQKTCDAFKVEKHISNDAGSLKFDPINLKQCDAFSDSGLALYFKAIWANGGKSYSRPFAVVFSDKVFAQIQDDPVFTDPSPYNPPPGTEDEDVGAVSPSGTSGSDSPWPTNGFESSASSPRTGLELGAIIGIAVGCGLAGLLAVLGIIWFVVRRRQQKQDLGPIGSFNSDNRGDDLMAEKEAHTGVDVDASPHSPYSDDGHANGAYPPGTSVTTAAAAAAAVTPHQQDRSRSYTPYSDQPGAAATQSIRTDSIALNDDGSRANIPSPIPGRVTPRGLTTPYAHLVEEGMTEEEIRRLEEEERQLDAAIEQAGRR